MCLSPFLSLSLSLPSCFSPHISLSLFVSCVPCFRLYVLKQLNKHEIKLLLAQGDSFFRHFSRVLLDGQPSTLTPLFGLFQISRISTHEKWYYVAMSNLRFRGGGPPKGKVRVFDLKGLGCHRYIPPSAAISSSSNNNGGAAAAAPALLREVAAATTTTTTTGATRDRSQSPPTLSLMPTESSPSSQDTPQPHSGISYPSSFVSSLFPAVYSILKVGLFVCSYSVPWKVADSRRRERKKARETESYENVEEACLCDLL